MNSKDIIEEKLPMLSNLNMNPIYSKVVSELEEDKVSAFCIFDKAPDDIVHFSLPNRRELIYFNNCENIADIIIDEIKNGKANEKAPDYAVHSLSNKNVGIIYRLAMFISNMLDIPCPQIGLSDNIVASRQRSAKSNFVCLPSKYSGPEMLVMISILCYDLRCLWQYKNKPEYYDMLVSDIESEENYNNPAKLDADAFACLLEEKIMGYSRLDFDSYANGNKSVKQKVRDIMNSIELDEAYLHPMVELARKCLGLV